jgi:predicted MFS family arabinose efflux permease
MGALGLGRFGYTMLLPATREGLRLSYTQAGFLATANLGGYLAGSLLAGRFNRLGVPLAAGSGLLAVAMSLAWTGRAESAFEAAVAQCLAGVAAAIVYVQALGLVARLPARSKGLASGVMHAGNGAGLIMAGLGIPSVLTWAGPDGWRTAWLTLSVATVAIAPVVGLGFPPSPVPWPEAPFDTGSVRSPNRPPAVLTWACLAGLFGLSYIIYTTFFAETLRAQGLSLPEAGRAWAAVGALSLLSGPAWGALSDRLGRMTALALLFGLQALAYACFLFEASWSLIVSVAVFGPTAWGIPAVTAAAMGDARPDEAVAAFARVTTASGLGQAAGPFLAGVVADATGVVSSGLWVSIAAAALGALWSLGRAGRWPLPARRTHPGPT